MNIKEELLLFIGDVYVITQWKYNDNEMVYCIFKDHDEGRIPNFTISQLEGPWKKFEYKDDKLTQSFDDEYNELYLEAQKRAEKIKFDLNQENDIVWAGNIDRQ